MKKINLFIIIISQFIILKAQTNGITFFIPWSGPANGYAVSPHNPNYNIGYDDFTIEA